MVLTCGFIRLRGSFRGHAEAMILSLGYLILRHLHRLMILVLRGDRANSPPCPGCFQGHAKRRSSSPRLGIPSIAVTA